MKHLLACVIFLCFSSTAQVQAGNYVIGVESLEYFPIYQGQGGSYKGYARDLLDEFAKSAGHSFTYKPVPIKRLFNEFLAGNMDFKFPDNPMFASSMKQGHNITYSDSAVEIIDGIMAMKSNTSLNVENFNNLGTLRGFTPWVYMDQISKGVMKLSEANDVKALISMVESGRIQGAFFNIIVSRYYLNNTLKKPDLLEFKSDLPHSRADFMLSTMKHPEIIAQFNEFLKSNQSTVEALKDKYQVRLP